VQQLLFFVSVVIVFQFVAVALMTLILEPDMSRKQSVHDVYNYGSPKKDLMIAMTVTRM